MFSEHFRDIARTGIGAGHIDHSLVHAHIADDRTTFATHPHFAAVVREPTIETIGIADRNDRDRAIFGERRVSTIPDRLTRFDGLDGKDGRLQGTDIA